MRILEFIVIALLVRSVIGMIYRALLQKPARQEQSKPKRFEADRSTIVDGEFKNLK